MYGIEPEVARWQSVWIALQIHETTGIAMIDTDGWLETCDEAGFFWPMAPEVEEDGTVVSANMPPANPGDLVHQVGFHYYHHEESYYQDDQTLKEEVESYIAGVVGTLMGMGRSYEISLSVSEAGFPADSSGEAEHPPFNPEASPMFQAGMLVRRLLTAWAAGAERVAWHTFMSRVTVGVPMGVYGACGLRNDIFTAENALQRTAAAEAYRRPAWFAIRRLAWLLTLTQRKEVLRSDAGVQVIRLESDGGFFVPEDDTTLAAPSGHRYRYAYVFWMDQEATVSSYDLVLSDEAGNGYERLPLVPEVTPTVPATEVDENGFAAGEGVDWEWAGWDWCEVSASGGTLTCRLQPASDDAGRPGPVCLLTDAEYGTTSLTLGGRVPGLVPEEAWNETRRRLEAELERLALGYERCRERVADLVGTPWKLEVVEDRGERMDPALLALGDIAQHASLLASLLRGINR